MEKKNISYHEKRYIDNTIRLRTILAELPPYVQDFCRGRQTTLSMQTQIAYCYDLKIFFQFLQTANPELKSSSIRNISLEVLERLQPTDIEEFQNYLKVYLSQNSGESITNGEIGISRKLSALRSLYDYLFKHEMVKNNPTRIVDVPKIHEKAIIQLDPDEIVMILDAMEAFEDNLTPHQKGYYEKTKTRDIAIITLFLGTGLRVSECVGLDLKDVNFNNRGLRVIRKGGNEKIVYFGDEVEKALLDYLEEREKYHPVSGHENALFLSLQGTRMSVRAMEKMVKKYTQPVITNKKITPHKLRSTYGTALYEETGDIYLVADVLGHKSVSTTQKHYAKLKDSRRRAAASAVRLRESLDPEEKEN